MADDSKRESLIVANMGLVHACANRFRGRGVDYDDLFQSGCIGLIKAVDGFDESRGFAFSTYAVPVILGEIKRIFRDGGAVKVGRTLKEKARLAMREREMFVVSNGCEPTVGELAEIMGLDIEQMAEVLNAAAPTVSLNCDSNEHPQIQLSTDSPEESVSDRIALMQVIGTLERADRSIIELRYFRGLTQAKTAEALGMTQVQVSRREKKILQELRSVMAV